MSVGRKRRCSHDDVNWPDTRDYYTCPLCGRETWLLDKTEGLDMNEARELVTEARRRRELREQFERYYRERERKRMEAELKRGVSDEELEALLRETTVT